MPIVVTNLHPRLRFPHTDARRLVRAVCRGEGTRVSAVNVVFINHRRTIALNTKYLRRRGTTEVIAFCYAENPLEGDIFVNLDQARRQKSLYGVSFREEVARLIIHGTLHCAGYDDATGRQRETMTRRENRYLESF